MLCYILPLDDAGCTSRDNNKEAVCFNWINLHTGSNACNSNSKPAKIIVIYEYSIRVFATIFAELQILPL